MTSALLTFALLPPSASAQSPPPTGEALYRSACATCHGRDGKGGAVERLALPTPPPDFSDCTFAPREADGDWASIIRDGGPARAFHRMMPAFGDALSDDEIALVLGHVRTFCAEPAYPRGELNLPRSLVTEKAFPEDETVFTAAVNAEDAGSVGTAVIYEKRFGARNQVEFKLPVAAHETSTSSWRGGVGDIALAFKRVLVSSLRTGTIIERDRERPCCRPAMPRRVSARA